MSPLTVQSGSHQDKEDQQRGLQAGLDYKNFQRELLLAPLRQDFTKFRELLAPEQIRPNKKNEFN